MHITVIIPIYKVEAYVERCVRTLLEQDMPGVEYIFVDDCSPDNSLEKARNAAAKYLVPPEQIKFLRHDVNRGLPAARNTGMKHATGEYIFHCDSDDHLEPDALRKMYEAARHNDADIVYSDWYLTFPGSKRYMKQPAYSNTEDALRGLLHGTMKYNVWNKLVRRSLYTENHITFPEGHSMGEDMTMIMLFAKARSVAYLPIATYNYVRQNENAFTAQRTEQSYADLLFNASRVIDYLQGTVSEQDLACFKLNVKFPFLISGQRRDYERWNEWLPEANQFISISQVSMRMRILQMAAAKKWYLILKIYYYCLHRIVYGIIY